MTHPLISVCIPSYNRPELLARLLTSIDAKSASIEIVICEDHSPRRAEIRVAVERFSAASSYRVAYRENDRNLGYDKNLRELIRVALGEFVVFMGDDDEFEPGGLDAFAEFLRAHADVGYVLRSYVATHEDGGRELFRYFPTSRVFQPGFESYVLLFRRSVSLAGVTFRRALVAEYLIDDFDGMLLFQLYLVAEIALHYPTAFCDIPFVRAEQTYRTDVHFFGASQAEQGRFVAGKVLPSNSINFMKGYFAITEYLDRKYGFQSTEVVRRDISKYSYTVLSIQRKHGLRVFLQYARTLKNQLHLGRTPYFYLYAVGLAAFGERACDRLIRLIKLTLGRTPQL